jgi:hypothetical protein
MTHNLSNAEAEKLGNMKMWPWNSKISGSLTTYLNAP